MQFRCSLALVVTAVVCCVAGAVSPTRSEEPAVLAVLAKAAVANDPCHGGVSELLFSERRIRANSSSGGSHARRKHQRRLSCATPALDRIARGRAFANVPSPFEWYRLFEGGAPSDARWTLEPCAPASLLGAVCLRWEASGASDDRHNPFAWSGRVTLDADSGAVLSLEAESNWQDRILLAHWRRQNQRTRFGFFLFAWHSDTRALHRAPRGIRLRLYQAEMLAGRMLPLRYDLEAIRAQAGLSITPEPIQRTTFEFADYGIPRVETEQRLAGVAP